MGRKFWCCWPSHASGSGLNEPSEPQWFQVPFTSDPSAWPYPEMALWKIRISPWHSDLSAPHPVGSSPLHEFTEVSSALQPRPLLSFPMAPTFHIGLDRNSLSSSSRILTSCPPLHRPCDPLIPDWLIAKESPTQAGVGTLAMFSAVFGWPWACPAPADRASFLLSICFWAKEEVGVDWRESVVAMDGKSSLLQTHLLLPLPCCCSQITQKPVHPAAAAAAPCLEALAQQWLLQPQSLQICLPRLPLGIWGPAFHGFSWSALSQEKTCFLCRGDQGMELRESIGDSSSPQGGLWWGNRSAPSAGTAFLNAG